jgi:integrase
MVAAMRRGGAGAKLINNAITLLGQVFDHGLDRGWCNANPARKVRRPRVEQSDAIRFLDQAEVEAMLRAAASDTDRALFLTAVMTGLRQGELLGLQWRDVDWQAGKLHVRRSYVRGHWGTPKSRRSSRAVPMADRVARELARPSACDIQGRRRPRVLPPRHRDGARPLRPGAPLQARAQRRRRA